MRSCEGGELRVDVVESRLVCCWRKSEGASRACRSAKVSEERYVARSSEPGASLLRTVGGIFAQECGFGSLAVGW